MQDMCVALNSCKISNPNQVESLGYVEQSDWDMCFSFHGWPFFASCVSCHVWGHRTCGCDRLDSQGNCCCCVLRSCKPLEASALQERALSTAKKLLDGSDLKKVLAGQPFGNESQGPDSVRTEEGGFAVSRPHPTEKSHMPPQASG